MPENKSGYRLGPTEVELTVISNQNLELMDSDFCKGGEIKIHTFVITL